MSDSQKPVNSTPPLPGNDAAYPLDVMAMGPAFKTETVSKNIRGGENANTNRPAGDTAPSLG